eukprot:CAMPEP_0179184636 /NCGR_PEP_ID=MMETSP0796-20121207/91542_1 /TAXON_ID=73915 /ORGANISM="Pyrodinium bahamense, Strain pbaha01" /LENGTH=260 /DNA_ID=CAMNT_0020888573 /DNA_START=193 /DNA_END=973 /DNA_ORIENTATION=-
MPRSVRPWGEPPRSDTESRAPRRTRRAPAAPTTWQPGCHPVGGLPAGPRGARESSPSRAAAAFAPPRAVPAPAAPSAAAPPAPSASARPGPCDPCPGAGAPCPAAGAHSAPPAPSPPAAASAAAPAPWPAAGAPPAVPSSGAVPPAANLDAAHGAGLLLREPGLHAPVVEGVAAGAEPAHRLPGLERVLADGTHLPTLRAFRSEGCCGGKVLEDWLAAIGTPQFALADPRLPGAGPASGTAEEADLLRCLHLGSAEGQVS